MERSTLTDLPAIRRKAGAVRRNSTSISWVQVSSLRSHPASPRKFKTIDERAAARIVEVRDVIPPLVIDADGTVLVGEVIYRAARRLGLEELPVMRVEHLSDVEALELSVAYQRLNEIGEWDRGQLGALNLRFEIEIPGYEPEQIGFEVGAMDVMIGELPQEDPEEEDDEGLSASYPVSEVGDIWQLGKHRLVCGDSTDPATFAKLMAGVSPAALVFSDPPFGCKIDGFVASSGRHREFVMGSGEMAPDELFEFFRAFIEAFLPHIKSGAVVEIVIDWRSLHLMLRAAEPLLGPLINLAVWVKDRPGQGSFLRSQHELVLIFKAGKGRFRNNVMLGKHGRSRSNVWSYPSAKTASTGSDEGDMLKNHPTPKCVRMVADAILDCTKRGEIVIDAFLGSGTTLIAADKVGRVCHAVELDPLYVDLAIRRWQAWSGEQAVHSSTGRSFDEIESERRPAE